jgi:hypothetical protein
MNMALKTLRPRSVITRSTCRVIRFTVPVAAMLPSSCRTLAVSTVSTPFL